MDKFRAYRIDEQDGKIVAGFQDLSVDDLTRIIVFATAVTLLLIAATSIRKQMRQTAEQLERQRERDLELQEREYERLGGTQTLRADVRRELQRSVNMIVDDQGLEVSLR